MTIRALILAFAVLGLGFTLEAKVRLSFSGNARQAEFRKGGQIFFDASTCLCKVPRALAGKTFVVLPTGGWRAKVEEGGDLIVLTPVGEDKESSQEAALQSSHFERDDELGKFRLYKQDKFGVCAWRKKVTRGESLSFGKWAVPVDAAVYGPGDAIPSEPANVDLGRQMFLNDRLIAACDAKRVWHKPVKYKGNPVLRPETFLEKGGKDGRNPMSAPFSGGVWYDGLEKLFRCWYIAGWAEGVAYAWSKDGIDWVRPKIQPDGGNLVFASYGQGDSSAIVMDPDAADGWRWKAFNFQGGTEGFPRGGCVRVSKDGLVWTNDTPTAKTGDRSTVFYNPFSKKWCYSIRTSAKDYGRSRDYAEADDFIEGAKTFAGRRKWLRHAAAGRKNTGEELYNMDCVAYESVMIGLAMILNQPQNTYWALKGLPKLTDLRFGFNAIPEDPDAWQFPKTEDLDGFFIESTRMYGTWDMGYLQSNAGICLIVGDELRFYYTGFAGDPGRKDALQGNYTCGMYANATMGYASLRRDGFCSMERGSLLTRKLVFDKGDRLWANVDAKKGLCVIRIEDSEGRNFGERKIEGADSTRFEVGALESGKPFRLRITCSGEAKFYSFWTSDGSGKSGGYLAAGAVGSPTLRDE